MYESPEMYSLAQDGQRGSVAANTNWVGNAIVVQLSRQKSKLFIMN